MFDDLTSRIMRTTLNLDMDVLQAAKERARREGKTMGKFISDALRNAMNSSRAPQPAHAAEQPRPVYGFRPFPKQGRIVTNELINKLREDDAY